MVIYLTSETEKALKEHIPYAEIESRIRHLVWRLNKVSGIVTVGSCEGHAVSTEEDGLVTSNAYVVTRVTRDRLIELLELAPDCGITTLALSFLPDWFGLELSWEPSNYDAICLLVDRLCRSVQQ